MRDSPSVAAAMRHPWRIGACAAVLLLTLAHASGWWPLPWVQRWEGQLADLRLALVQPRTLDERVVVIDVSEERDQPLTIINPEILWASDEKQVGDEGCLSVPGIYDGVERSVAVKIKALDENGNSREIDAEGLLAICIQHEMDHLLGKVFVEYLSPLKRNRIKSKLVKQQKRELADAKD